MFVVDVLLVVFSSSLFVVCCVLFAVCGSLVRYFLFDVCSRLSFVCCVLVVYCSSLFVVCCLLFVVRCRSLFVVRCSSFVFLFVCMLFVFVVCGCVFMV